MRFNNALYFCQIVESLTVKFIVFISVILGRLWEVFFSCSSL